MESLDFQGLSIDTTEDAAYLVSLALTCCCKELGVQDLARIAASSKHLKEACVAIARRDLPELLGAAVAQAAEAEAKCSAAHDAALAAYSADNTLGYGYDYDYDALGYGYDSDARPFTAYTSSVVQQQTAYHLQVHAVAWLLRAAPVEAASPAAVDCVLCIPAVSQQAAVQMVEAGMRVSFAQLLRAADRVVEGVEVWGRAQQQLGVQTDIPEDAIDICRREVSVFSRWVSCYLCIHAVFSGDCCQEQLPLSHICCTASGRTTDDPQWKFCANLTQVRRTQGLRQIDTSMLCMLACHMNGSAITHCMARSLSASD
jgi:hypothetical protein